MRKVCAYRLYTYFLRHGLKDVIVVSLEVLHVNATKRQLVIQEQMWMDRLSTLIPFGYNFKRAVKGQVQAPLAVYRVNGFRDMPRRIAYISDLLEKNSLSLANAHEKFRGYNTKVLLKMLSCLQDVNHGRYAFDNGIYIYIYDMHMSGYFPAFWSMLSSFVLGNVGERATKGSWFLIGATC
jgi:hypothetical protein